NAVEAAAETDEKRVDIVFVDMDNSVVIIIKNSTKPLTMPIEQLVKKGVTTKEGHAGMGTTFVVSVVDKLDNARFSLECVDNVFVQKLEIGKEEV
ncbi:MAG: GHKL domain-containing protein, partial [Lachnospiraceae bacterium]|nr:GHKL domain-containing protein [Lachnospiraceae bacterium]